MINILDSRQAREQPRSATYQRGSVIWWTSLSEVNAAVRRGYDLGWWPQCHEDGLLQVRTRTFPPCSAWKTVCLLPAKTSSLCLLHCTRDTKADSDSGISSTNYHSPLLSHSESSDTQFHFSNTKQPSARFSQRPQSQCSPLHLLCWPRPPLSGKSQDILLRDMRIYSLTPHSPKCPRHRPTVHDLFPPTSAHALSRWSKVLLYLHCHRPKSCGSLCAN